MKLAEYLKLEDMRQVAFVKKSGLSAPVVNRLVHERAPKVSWRTIQKVHQATEGRVTASDILQFDRVGQGAAAE